MAIEGRDLGDSQILNDTVQATNDKGDIQLKTVLPSGRPLVSEFMNPDSVKGSVLISWCENVRQQVDLDEQERKAKAKRKVDEEVVQEKAKDLVDVPPDDESPIDYAKRQRDAYQSRVNILEARIVELQTERKKIRSNLEQWEKVVKTLRGETDE